ncbi:MAG: hypothetical protein WCQ90_03935 [Deltaproteobacteria bacterium]
MTQRIVTISFILIALCFLTPVPELQAPEITEHDIFGYDTYRVAEDGAIFDRDGTIKGWVHGNTVYDAGWNEKYIIRGNRLHGANIDSRG